MVEFCCRNYYVEIGGLGKPLVAKEGVFCAAYHRTSNLEVHVCRARVECITNSGKVSTVLLILHNNIHRQCNNCRCLPQLRNQFLVKKNSFCVL